MEQSPDSVEHRIPHSSNEWVIWSVVFVVVLCISFFIGYQFYKNNQRFTDYDGTRGTFVIETVDLGTLQQYRVHVYDDHNTKYLIPLRYPPWDVDQEVFLEKKILQALNKHEGIARLYVTQDPELSNTTHALSMVAAGEFIRILGKQGYGVYQLNVKSAFTSSVSEQTIPVVTCANVTSEDSVVLLQLGTENKVYSNNGCVIIEGVDSAGLVMAADAFSYHLLGVL